MKAIKSFIQRFAQDEKGLETIEYAIITGLIVAGTIASIATIAIWISARFNTLESRLNPVPYP